MKQKLRLPCVVQGKSETPTSTTSDTKPKQSKAPTSEPERSRALSLFLRALIDSALLMFSLEVRDLFLQGQ